MNLIKITILILILVAVISIPIFIFKILSKKPPAPPLVQQYSPQPVTSGLSAITVSQNQLTSTEESYSEAPLQPFPGYDLTQNGTLVVTSDPTAARILIDAREDDLEGPSQGPPPPPDQVPATKITPFKMTVIPAGKHTVTVFKKGYSQQEVEFIIEANKITRLNVVLSAAKYDF